MENEPITTTLNKIRKHAPCSEGWEQFLKYKGKTKADDEEFPMVEILDSNGLDDCLWALRSRPDLSNLWRLYAVDAARQVEHLMQDERSKTALKVAESHALGDATDEELSAAWAAAWAAARDARAAWDDRAARDARAAAKAAARAARAAMAAARAAAWDARAAARDAGDVQEKMLRQMLTTGERPQWPNSK